MKKFNFKLKVVLKERLIREDERKKELALSLKKLSEAKDQLSRLGQKKESLFSAMKHQKQLASPDVKLLRNYETYLSQMNKFIQNQQIQIIKATQNVRESQLKLTGATLRKKILETLKDHQRKAYYLDMEKVEMKNIDEFNMIRANA